MTYSHLCKYSQIQFKVVELVIFYENVGFVTIIEPNLTLVRFAGQI
jgi:hypothetical protein